MGPCKFYSAMLYIKPAIKLNYYITIIGRVEEGKT